MPSFNGFVAPTIEEAISAYIEARFSRVSGYDTLPPDIEMVRAFAFDTLNRWRGAMRRSAGLTEAGYLDAERTITTGVGDVPQAQATIAKWAEIERKYEQSVNLVKLAGTIADIELILARRYSNG